MVYVSSNLNYPLVLGVSESDLMKYILVYPFDSDNPGLYSIVHLPPKSHAYDLLSKMLEYVILHFF